MHADCERFDQLGVAGNIQSFGNDMECQDLIIGPIPLESTDGARGLKAEDLQAG